LLVIHAAIVSMMSAQCLYDIVLYFGGIMVMLV